MAKRTIRVEQVIEEDVDRVLFGGHDTATNEQVTFHLKRPSMNAIGIDAVDQMARKVRTGEIVEVRL